MRDNFVDFRTIKRSVSLTSVLDRYGIKLRKVNQYSLRGKCPLPTHSSEKSNESFSVHVGKNVWACQSNSCASARGGKKGGNLLDFVSAMEGCSIREAALKLSEWFPSADSRASRKPNRAKRKRSDAESPATEVTTEGAECSANEPLTFTLKNIDPSHPYLRRRGLREETARQFGVGFFSGRGSISGRVVIPIHNSIGELVAYAGRALDDDEPKYRLPTGFQKSIELFNLHRLGDRRRIVVVEGFFDCMKVHQAGFPCVALMGCSLSDEQEKRLQSFEAVVLFLDGDEAGREAARLIAARLNVRMFVRIVELPDGVQPDQLSSGEIKATIGSL